MPKTDGAVVRPIVQTPFETGTAFIALASRWFSPQQPVTPQAPVGTPARERDYPVGYNLQYQPRAEEEVTFGQLRQLAYLWDLVAIVIETRKDQVASIPWVIQAKRLPEETNLEFKQRHETVDGIDELTDRFRRPDGHRLWHSWIRQLVHEHLVTDALCILPRGDGAGPTPYLDMLDGATIKILIDSEGRRPLPPSQAYQQIIKGIPAFDFTAAELYYYMRNPRVDRIYGFSPVEQIIATINLGIRKYMYDLGFYTEGNLPEAIVQMPETWPIDKIRQFSEWFNSVLAGQVDQRRKAFFIPGLGGPNAISYPKQSTGKDEIEMWQWLARIICYAFSISPQPFIREMNRATAVTAQEAAREEGLQPLLDWLKEVFDDLLARVYGRDDLEWTWKPDENPDKNQEMQINTGYVKTGVLAVNEVREDLGRDPVDGGDQPMALTGTGWVPLGTPAQPNGGDGGEPGGGDAAGDAVVQKRRRRGVSAATAFRGDRAKRVLGQTTKLVERYLADRGQEAARRLAAAYERLALGVPEPRKMLQAARFEEDAPVELAP